MRVELMQVYGKTVMERVELQRYLDTLLEVARFKDYCPNGLQVEGRAQVRRIVCGVTASQALLDAAVARGADAVLVHHGYFWRGRTVVSPECVGSVWRHCLVTTSICSPTICPSMPTPSSETTHSLAG
jgi:putative NIF3 family GTP cyclohydrolase 1 type 2